MSTIISGWLALFLALIAAWLTVFAVHDFTNREHN